MIEVDGANFLAGAEGHAALLGNHFLAGGVQIIAKLDHEGMLVSGHKLFVGTMLDAAESLDTISDQLGSLGVLAKFVPSKLLGPGVGTADALVTEIDAAMVRVVMAFALDLLHGIVSSHGGTGGPIDGIEVGLVGLVHDVLGEWLALVEDAKALPFRFLNGEVGPVQNGGENEEGGKEENI